MQHRYTFSLVRILTRNLKSFDFHRDAIASDIFIFPLNSIKYYRTQRSGMKNGKLGKYPKMSVAMEVIT